MMNVEPALDDWNRELQRGTIITKRVHVGEYGCDTCDEIHVEKFYLFHVRPGIKKLLCPRCASNRIFNGKATGADIVEIYEVTARLDKSAINMFPPGLQGQPPTQVM